MLLLTLLFFFFFFNDTATTEIYTLSLHDALPISLRGGDPTGNHRADQDSHNQGEADKCCSQDLALARPVQQLPRSEEHTSELQSRSDLVCRLLLEKKKKIKTTQ